jgi:hypothetical protein
MYKLEERWRNPRFQNHRMRSFKYVKDNFFVDDDILEVQHFNPGTGLISNFFEEVGYLTRTGVLRVERVWHTYSPGILMGWPLWEPAAKKWRRTRRSVSVRRLRVSLSSGC